MNNKKQEYHRCPNCNTWCWLDKTFSWVCPACGVRERRAMNSVVEPRLEKRGFIPSAWDKITHF